MFLIRPKYRTERVTRLRIAIQPGRCRGRLRLGLHLGCLRTRRDARTRRHQRLSQSRAFSNRCRVVSNHFRNRLGVGRRSSCGLVGADARYTRAQPRNAKAKASVSMVAVCASRFIEVSQLPQNGEDAAHRYDKGTRGNQPGFSFSTPSILSDFFDCVLPSRHIVGCCDRLPVQLSD